MQVAIATYSYFSLSQMLLLLAWTTSSSGQTLQAIYDDGSVRSFSIASNDGVVSYQIPEGTKIPSLAGFCKSPLLHSCFRAQDKNGTEFYSPANSRDAFHLERVIQNDNEISFRKRVVSFNCDPNDFVIASDDLLVACRPKAANNTCTYLLNNECHNFPPPNNIENLIADPVTFSVPDMEPDNRGGRIVSVVGRPSRRGMLRLIVFFTNNELRPHDIPVDCQAPLKLSRQESTVLLTCANVTQYMVNVTRIPVGFFRIDPTAHGSLLALSNKGYALFSFPLQLTLQNITSGHAVTVSINDNQGSIIYADFSSHGNYAFVVTNITVMFIHVIEALTGPRITVNSQSIHFFPIQTCFTCPSVQFINSTVAVISARDGEHVTTLLFVTLNQWPPYVFLNKTLNGFPKQYWFVTDPFVPQTSILPTTTDKVAPPSSTSTTVMSDRTKPTTISTDSPGNLDGSSDNSTIVVAIFVPIICCLLLFVVIFAVYSKCKSMQSETVDSRQNNHHVSTEYVQEQTRHHDTAHVNTESVQEQSKHAGTPGRSSTVAAKSPIHAHARESARHRKPAARPTQETINQATESAKIVSATSMDTISPVYGAGEQVHQAELDSTNL